MIEDAVKENLLKLSVESEMLAQALQLQSEAFDFFVDTENDEYVRSTTEEVLLRLKNYVEAMQVLNFKFR